VENERVLIQIKQNKYKNDAKVFRKEILQKQADLQLKLRINENQRLIILDLMHEREALSEAVRLGHGDWKEVMSSN
jgi:hypothetical protein